MALISLAQWCSDRHMDMRNARRYAAEGRLATAVKIGRNWVIDDADELTYKREEEKNEND